MKLKVNKLNNGGGGGTKSSGGAMTPGQKKAYNQSPAGRKNEAAQKAARQSVRAGKARAGL